MELFDFALILGADQKLREVVWSNPALEEQRRHHLLKNGQAEKLLQAIGGEEQGRIAWHNVRYSFKRLAWRDHVHAVLFSAGYDQVMLYTHALELVAEGVQIYDREGYLVFCNRTSRRISAIPPEADIVGRHMLDIWNVDEEMSASLSSMRTNSPVKNRVDTFPSLSGGDVTTVNTAYPLADDGVVKGAVLFERDIAVIQEKKREIDNIAKALQGDSAGNALADSPRYTFDHIIGDSSALRTAVELARKFAAVDCHILLIGETGTGKEMFAQSIHRESSRSQKNFVAINCAAMPETLVESMLFGTAKGAFTGSENKAGLFEEANGGTLFLDELNSMSMAMQAKILRVIQEGVFRRIGGGRDQRTDVRIVSSSNEDPYRLVEAGSIRRDLFYRLSSVQIQIPPLRDRPEDLEPLIERYMYVKKYQFAKRIDYVAPEVLAIFREYSWPGNVRELFHVLDYAMNVMEEGVIDADCLPAHFTGKPAPKQDEQARGTGPDLFDTRLADIIGDYEADILRQVLEHYGGNISRAAASLGICRQSLSYRLHKYGIVV